MNSTRQGNGSSSWSDCRGEKGQARNDSRTKQNDLHIAPPSTMHGNYPLDVTCFQVAHTITMSTAPGTCPLVGHPYLSCSYTLSTIPVATLKAERARTWSSCAAHSTNATRTVRKALLQQSLGDNKCYRAGERVTELDCQGEEGRVGNNRHFQNKYTQI